MGTFIDYSHCTFNTFYGWERERPKHAFTIFWPHLQLYLKGIIDMLCPDDKKFLVSFIPRDKHDHPAKIDGLPTWSTSDPAVLQVQPQPDGTAWVVAGNPGNAQINCTADADLGDGQIFISGILEVEVVPGAAVSLAVEAGPLVDQ